MNGMIQRLTRYKGLLLSITCFVGFGVLVLTDFGDGLRDSIVLLVFLALGAVGLLTGAIETIESPSDKWHEEWEKEWKEAWGWASASDPRSEEYPCSTNPNWEPGGSPLDHISVHSVHDD